MGASGIESIAKSDTWIGDSLLETSVAEHAERVGGNDAFLALAKVWGRLYRRLGLMTDR